MVAILPLRPASGGVIRSRIVLSADAVAALETGLAAAEARVATILAAGKVKHMKGRCGPESTLYPGPCDEAQMKKYLIQSDLYEQARQKVKNALAITPQPVDRERWYSASARWVNVMALADNLAWTYQSGRAVGTSSGKAPGGDDIFAMLDADTFAEDLRKRVFDEAQLVKKWAHKGDRKVHIDLQQGLPVLGAGGSRVRGIVGAASDNPWIWGDDYFAWSPWTDYDTVGVWKDCGGVFGGACPGYPSGKRYHRTIYANGATRVAWWKKKLEVYSKHPLADLLAYTWAGYSEYIDLNAGALGLTSAQMRALAEAKNRADVQAGTAKFELIKYIPVFGQIMWAILWGLAEVLPLASGCQFSFYEYPERVIDLAECGAWVPGSTAASTVPKMYSALIAQGFDPQARLDELNAPPPPPPPETPPWLVPTLATVGGIVLGSVIGKAVS